MQTKHKTTQQLDPDGVDGRMQALKQIKEGSKLLVATGSALAQFEATAAAWQQTSRELDGALREMGDVAHFLAVLQADAAKLAEQVSIATQVPPAPQGGSASNG